MPSTKIGRLEEELFRQHWVRFPDDIAKIKNVRCPGVYVLALTKTNLEGNRVSEEDISYVGMSNYASLLKRLRGFRRGLKKGRGHTGANRLFGKPLDGSFFVAGVGVPCKTKKADRTADDLRRMGIVAALEMFVMARIKSKFPDREPHLNKK